MNFNDRNKLQSYQILLCKKIVFLFYNFLNSSVRDITVKTSKKTMGYFYLRYVNPGWNGKPVYT